MSSPARTMVESLFSNQEETKKPEFVKAKETTLFSQDDANSPVHNISHKFKGIVNAADSKQIFSVVGKDYKLVQHSDMYDMVEKTVKDLGFKSKIKTEQSDDGARLRMTLTFPDIFIQIGPNEKNDIVNLKMAFDNSYNLTTGLRANVLGDRLACANGLIVPEAFAYFYHKHSKGLDENNLIPTVEKGIEVFQTKIKEKFERYYATKIDPDKVRNFLKELHGEKFISMKYIEMMIARMDKGGDIEIRGAGQITNQWMLYNLVTEVLTHETTSSKTQEEFTTKMDLKIQSNIKNLVMA